MYKKSTSYPELWSKIPVEQAQEQQGRPDSLFLREKIQQHLEVGGAVVRQGKGAFGFVLELLWKK